MPYTETEDTPVEVTGLSEPVLDTTLWSWLRADIPLSGDVGGYSMRGWFAFVFVTWPTWMIRDVEDAMRRGLDEQRALIGLEMRSGKPINRAVNRGEDG
jgi:hypothetical protein